MSGARLLLLVVVAALVGGVVYAARTGTLPLARVLRPAATTGSEGRAAAFAALERSPRDVGRWLALGEEAQREGDLVLARAAFRAAQEIAPHDGTAHARLGFLLYEEGHDEEALAELKRAREKGADVDLLDFTLSMMRAHVDLAGPFPRFSEDDDDRDEATRVATRGDDGEQASSREDADEDDDADDDADEPARDPEPERGEELEDEDEEEPDDPERGDPADDRFADARETPTVAPPGPAGACEIALERRGGQGIFIIDALVNGTPARLIVDTGASLTVLSRDFLAETGLRLDEDGVLTARTAAGPQRFGTAAVESVEVGERVARDIRVAICDECGMPGSDGLLGLDVQEPLGMSLFPGRGTVRFADCWD